MSSRCALLCCLILAGCTGAAGEPDAGTGADAGGFDAGPQPIKYTRFTRRTDGWPAGARLKGAAVVDNVLFAASDQGVLALPATDTRWTAVSTPLSGDQKPTSLQKVDQTLVLTAAGASSGGLYQKPLDGDWAQITEAPSTPTWLLSKKSSDFLLATTGGLFTATSLSGPWTRRSAMGTPLFAAALTHFVAAPAQQKLFAAGATGGLFESTDQGVTWVASAPRGPVEAIAASGAYVLVSTGMDGQQRSDNYGNTFRPAPNPIAEGVLLYQAQGSRFWAGGNGGLKSSDDNGVSFTDNGAGLPSGTPVRALFFAGSYVVVDTTDGPFVNQVE